MLTSEKDRKGTLLEMQLAVELRMKFSVVCSSLIFKRLSPHSPLVCILDPPYHVYDCPSPYLDVL